MLENTFIHIQGIGPKTEKALWGRGIYTWETFLATKGPIISSIRDPFIRSQIELSIDNRNNIKYFTERLSVLDQWRIYDAFRHKAVFLDIETTGGYQGMDEITMIGLYDGNSVKTFINGKNLSDFELVIADYDLVITFNGSCFDIPIIRRWFPNIYLPPGHIDLRFLFKKLGYSGGLKAIEKRFGLMRDSEIDGMDGYEAIKLWYAYQWGDKSALDLLIQYNTADIVNLKPLMETGYNTMKIELFS
ncbi:MAG: ribonuclease H-like domain-containing protein [Deltaproteobacteria bacterium]|nr:ribonuclease H-like domain-containing protein [Deltaproteobacteria bacterium]